MQETDRRLADLNRLTDTFSVIWSSEIILQSGISNVALLLHFRSTEIHLYPRHLQDAAGRIPRNFMHVTPQWNAPGGQPFCEVEGAFLQNSVGLSQRSHHTSPLLHLEHVARMKRVLCEASKRWAPLVCGGNLLGSCLVKGCDNDLYKS